LGQAILHIHTTYSDGTATVAEILDEVESNSQVNVVGFSDHDDVRAYFDALDWKASHPNSRVEPLWGVELTTWAFKHLLVFCFEPPFAEQAFPKFLSLPEAARQAQAVGGTIIVPHVDTFWIGLGIRRLRRLAHTIGLHGFELLNPYHGSPRAVANLECMNRDLGLLAIGGSDAHHLEDLYRVIVDFPGHSVADLSRAFHDRTATARWGWQPAHVPLTRQLRQHTRALVLQPGEQIQGWARRCLPMSRPAVHLVGGTGEAICSNSPERSGQLPNNGGFPLSGSTGNPLNREPVQSSGLENPSSLGSSGACL
jgi:predicted metal-dependent phosphoesterase TrpH